MFEKVRNFYNKFKTRHLTEKYILILVFSIFLPFYISIPIIVAACIYFLCSKERFKQLINAHYFRLYYLLGILILTVPLFYKNYYGFACAVLLIIYFVLEYFIKKSLTADLYEVICRLMGYLSFFIVFIAVFEKIVLKHDRVMGLTHNANYYAYIIEIVIFVCLYNFTKTKKKIYMLFILANFIVLFLTGCRSAWSAIVVGLFVSSIILNKKKNIVFLGITILILIVVLAFNPSLMPRYNIIDDSVAVRLDIWENAFKDFLDNPIFGKGLLAYFQVSKSYMTPHAHNVYIDLLESTGIIGTSIIVFFFGSVVRQLTIAFKLGNTDTKQKVALCAGVISSSLVHGLTDMPMMGVQTGLLLFLILAMRPKIVNN